MNTYMISIILVMNTKNSNNNHNDQEKLSIKHIITIYNDPYIRTITKYQQLTTKTMTLILDRC